jgi:hypothetical protein
VFERIEDALDYAHDFIETKKGDIGLEYVAYGSDQLLPRYPACVVAPGQTRTQKHGTHYFMRTFHIEMLVLHAKLSVSRAMRTKEDLELVTRTAQALGEDPTCGELALFSYFTDETPQNIRTGVKTAPVLGTQMSWLVEARVPFK